MPQLLTRHASAAVLTRGPARGGAERAVETGLAVEPAREGDRPDRSLRVGNKDLLGTLDPHPAQLRGDAFAADDAVQGAARDMARLRDRCRIQTWVGEVPAQEEASTPSRAIASVACGPGCAFPTNEAAAESRPNAWGSSIVDWSGLALATSSNDVKNVDTTGTVEVLSPATVENELP
ncbi:MAG: hypothetical protein WCF33_04180 [Pseudonocardiaceae bacterium]